MKTKTTWLCALLGTAVIAGPAAAQSNVTLYGKLYPYLVDERGSGATPAGTPVATLGATPTGTDALTGIKGMAAANSRWGIRGSEDLGDGLRAIYQLETVVSVDSGQGGNGSTFWNRDTFVGLRGGFGTLRLGLMDTPFKTYGDTVGVLGLSSGSFMSSSSVLRKVGFGTSSASSFHLRRANSIKYDSPSFGGLAASVQYSTDEGKTATRDPRLVSLGVRYENGPLYLAVAHEIHYDFFGGSANSPSARRNNADPANSASSRDHATQLTAVYSLNRTHKVEFDVIRKQYKENAIGAGRFESYKNTAFLAVLESRWSSQWATALQYVHANAGSCTLAGGVACSTDGLAGDKYTAAASYHLSRRTYLFGALSYLKNDKSGRFSNVELSSSPNAGEDIRQFAVGIAHSF